MQSDYINNIKPYIRANIEALICRLFSGANIQKLSESNYRVGSKGSLAITVLSDGNIVFYCHESGSGGDIFDLIMRVTGYSFNQSVDYAVAAIGLTSSSFNSPPPKKIEVKKPTSNSEKIKFANAILNDSQPIQGTLAETYLLKRGIKIYPDILRFHDGIYNFTAKKKSPALVVPVQDVNDEIIAIHFISLDPKTGYKVVGDGVQAKLSKGSIKGGAVRISGEHTQIGVCEGIEDALSLLQMHPTLTVWACLGGNIRNLQIPEYVNEVIIACDNDDAGLNHAHALYDRLQNDGVSVSVTCPPTGFKDFNQYLLEGK